MITRTVVFLAALTLASTAQAALHDRGGGLIYDDVLNVTWLQDANYAKTSGYNSTGRMDWGEAISWVANLTYYDNVRGVTYDDWRLPKIDFGAGVGYSPSTHTYDGSSLLGWNFSAPGTVHAGSPISELAHLFYNSLNNISFYDFAGNVNPDWVWGEWNSGPFINIMGGYTIDECFNCGPRGVGTSWGFGFYAGDQIQQGGTPFQWAVRDGDVIAASIPEPETYGMFLAGLGLIGLMARRKTA